jgi:catechol 2,3-dioxygenase-like lactoylglutathione lyase family enzyme
MNLSLRRIIFFTRRMDEMTAFYRDVLGLALLTDEPKWRELDGGGMRIALHDGEPWAGKAKLAFFTPEVQAARETLVGRGVKMNDVVRSGELELCDGKDPDGNVIQLSNLP